MMKDNIEELMKKALEGQELPYDPQAWNSIKSKLPKAKRRINFKKWTTIGFTATALAVSAFLIFSPKDSPTTSITKKQSTENDKSTSIQKASSISNEKSTHTSNNITQVNSYNEEQKEKFTTPILKEDYNLIQQIDEKYPNIVYPNVTSDIITDVTSISDNNQQPNSVASNDLKFPIIEATCQGDIFEWYNSNSTSVFLKQPNGSTIEIKSKEKFKLQLTEIGNYSLGNNNKTSFEEKLKFKIKANPSMNLAIENELNYENGLPILKSSVETYESRVNWRSNNIGFENGGKTANLPVFNKGRYEISATVISDFGCVTSETKIFISREEYNLLAVNAFNPNSSDYRKNTFIPFALTVRNTPFRMVILDPDNGGVIYETSDASNAWDGIDRRDGKLVAANKAYIWKVILQKPEPNEKSEYRGTIIRIP